MRCRPLHFPRKTPILRNIRWSTAFLVRNGDTWFIANENDGNGKSTCYDSCAAAWPPLQAEVRGDDVGDWSVIERDNGELQWAYKGKPVYMRFHDSVTEPRGDGLDGFHLLKP